MLWLSPVKLLLAHFSCSAVAISFNDLWLSVRSLIFSSWSTRPDIVVQIIIYIAMLKSAVYKHWYKILGFFNFYQFHQCCLCDVLLVTIQSKQGGMGSFATLTNQLKYWRENNRCKTKYLMQKWSRPSYWTKGLKMDANQTYAKPSMHHLWIHSLLCYCSCTIIPVG